MSLSRDSSDPILPSSFHSASRRRQAMHGCRKTVNSPSSGCEGEQLPVLKKALQWSERIPCRVPHPKYKGKVAAPFHPYLISKSSQGVPKVTCSRADGFHLERDRKRGRVGLAAPSRSQPYTSNSDICLQKPKLRLMPPITVKFKGGRLAGKTKPLIKGPE